jgi:hypothetical protein
MLSSLCLLVLLLFFVFFVMMAIVANLDDCLLLLRLLLLLIAGGDGSNVQSAKGTREMGHEPGAKTVLVEGVLFCNEQL